MATDRPGSSTMAASLVISYRRIFVVLTVAMLHGGVLGLSPVVVAGSLRVHEVRRRVPTKRGARHDACVIDEI
jgi:hypothetical protein